ncbi:MAG: ABC transporter ATP-binding protein [Mycoplasmataceae bacterium]|nr:ABC transporter ATP-binding protein [Mycoplasmataceae bacterium]
MSEKKPSVEKKEVAKKASSTKKTAVKKTTTSTKKPVAKSSSPQKKDLMHWTEIKEKMSKFPSPSDIAKENGLKPIIEIKDLKKNYGKLKVLKGVNFDIYETQDVGVIGANGAGKSTLSEIVAQVKESTSGEIKYSWGDTKRQISRGMGIQFQESTYPEGYKIIDLIQFYLDVNGITVVEEDENDKEFLKKIECDKCKKPFFEKVKPSSPTTKHRCKRRNCGYEHEYNVADKFITRSHFDSLLKVFQVDGITHKMANAVSGGQQQRFNILLGVLHQPKFLILDEVSTGLDVESRTDIKQFVKELMEENGGTLYLVTHNMDEIEFLSDRLVTVDAGKIVDDVMISQIHEIGLDVSKYVDSFFAYRDEKYRKEGRSKNDQSE